MLIEAAHPGVASVGMGEELERCPVEMVLCGACSDVVGAGARCPTCGEPVVGRGGPAPKAALDEALLDRVDVALAAQAALARRTATQRVDAADQLVSGSVILRGRLRRQRALLRARVAERSELVPGLRDALDRVQEALDRADRSSEQGHAWSMTARLPRDSSCPRVARRLLEAYAWEELDQREGEQAMLIASELATNALVHGDGAIVLKINRADNRLRIEVRDEGHPDHIGVVAETEGRPGGRGLWIIEQLASAWGTVDGAGLVWAELTVGAG